MDAPSLEALEMALNEQAKKDTSLSYTGAVILNGEVFARLQDLDNEKKRLQQGNGSMAAPDTSEIDAKLAEVEAEAEQWIVELRFSAISSDDYVKIVAKHPDAGSSLDDAAAWNAFAVDVARACYREAVFRGETKPASAWPFDWFLKRPEVGFGQLELMLNDVVNLNQRKPDRSFLSRRSKQSPTT